MGNQLAQPIKEDSSRVFSSPVVVHDIVLARLYRLAEQKQRLIPRVEVVEVPQVEPHPERENEMLHLKEKLKNEMVEEAKRIGFIQDKINSVKVQRSSLSAESEKKFGIPCIQYRKRLHGCLLENQNDPLRCSAVSDELFQCSLDLVANQQ